MDAVTVDARHVGRGHPVFIVAEIGINHNGDLALAKQAIEAAAEAGADAVKFQNYRTEDFIADRSSTYAYVVDGRTVVESQYEMFKRCELSISALHELKAHCDRRKVLFHSTPSGEAGIDDLVSLGVGVLKNGSDYLTNLPLIRAMARTGLPTVLSTGMATLGEIDDAVRAFREAGNEQLVLLHCTSAYPTSPDDVHLRKIPALATAFGCPVGLSDHTAGIVAAIGAVAFGACWIEKHFTLDRTLAGPDHRFSADPSEFRVLVEGIRVMERCLGESRIGPTLGEVAGREAYRLSCVAGGPLPAGHVLRAVDIVYRRPGTGVPPAQAHLLIGRRLRRALGAGSLIAPGDLL